MSETPPLYQLPPVIHQGTEDKWFFWDETWSAKVGPFETEKDAVEALKNYCETVLGEKLS